MKMSCVLLPLVVAVGVLLLAAPGICLPSGAPRSACVSMMPGHGAQSTDPVPYSIRLTDDREEPVFSYSPGQRVTVTVSLTTERQFRGILMQMREVGGTEPFGTWMNVAANTRTLSCSNTGDSVTHANIMYKGNSEFTWIAPRDTPDTMFPRLIEIRATVAAEMSTWWSNVTTTTITGPFPSGVSPCASMPVYVLLVAAVLSSILPRLSV